MVALTTRIFFWSAPHISHNPMIKCLLATPPELSVHASAQALAYAKAQAYAKANLDHVLPVSPRAEVLRSDPSVGKHLALLPLNTLRMPTWVFSARDHR